MDKKVEILLGSEKNINSVNVDTYDKIELTRKVSELTEFDVNDVVNSTEQFDKERSENPIYRIYGRIEFLSLLNGLKNGSRALADFFNPQYTGDSKTLINSFDFYLVTPASGQTYSKIIGTNLYKRSYQVIAGRDEFEIYNAGFSNSVYGEQSYTFSFKNDYDVSQLFDRFGYPVMELFLYAQYVKKSGEVVSRKMWSTATGNETKQTYIPKDLNVGDIVESNSGANLYDLIEYIPDEFYQAHAQPTTIYIKTKYGYNDFLEWSYNPYIPLRLRYFDSTLNTAKASQVIESTTFLNVAPVSSPSPSNTFNGTKTKKQTLITSLRTLEDWDYSSTSYYYWDDDDGILEFDNGGTYNIEFKTQIYLPEETDKYIAVSYLELDGTKISGTERMYLSNADPIQSVKITKSVYSSSELRVRVQLIPNFERKIELIPDYAATRTSDGTLIWRDILPQGYTDPLNGNGVDYPFFNGRRYLFEPIVFDVIPNLDTDPDLDHPNTLAVFSEIEYWQDADVMDIVPANDNLDEFGKPCQ